MLKSTLRLAVIQIIISCAIKCKIISQPLLYILNTTNVLFFYYNLNHSPQKALPKIEAVINFSEKLFRSEIEDASKNENIQVPKELRKGVEEEESYIHPEIDYEKMDLMKKHIRFRILIPLLKEISACEIDGESSFQIDDSFVFDIKGIVPSQRRQSLSQRLVENLKDEHMAILKRIGMNGWVYYEKNLLSHRYAIYTLLYNYFNFLIPSHSSNFVHPFDEFVNRNCFGLKIDGENKVSFVEGCYVYTDRGDPIYAVLCLLMHYKIRNYEMGHAFYKNFSFLEF